MFTDLLLDIFAPAARQLGAKAATRTLVNAPHDPENYRALAQGHFFVADVPNDAQAPRYFGHLHIGKFVGAGEYSFRAVLYNCAPKDDGTYDVVQKQVIDIPTEGKKLGTIADMQRALASDHEFSQNILAEVTSIAADQWHFQEQGPNLNIHRAKDGQRQAVPLNL